MDHSPQDIYVNCLPKDHGYPLWNPKPGQTLPPNYKVDGFQIGDVGIIDPKGGFDVLFNICAPSDHPLHRRHGVPLHSPIILNDEDVLTKSDENIFDHAISSGVVRHLTSSSDTNVAYEFTACSPEGAILILPHGATLYELRSNNQFRDLVFQYAVDWFGFVTKRLRRQISGRALFLVTGFYKARSWLHASFQNAPPGGLIKAAKVGDGSDYAWKSTFRMNRNHGHDHNHVNQTIFLRGFWITLKDDSFGLGPQPVVEEVPSHKTPGDASLSFLKWPLRTIKKHGRSPRVPSIAHNLSNAFPRLLQGLMRDIGDFKQWIGSEEHSIYSDTPTLLDNSSSSSSKGHNVLVYNALAHIRSQNWSLALQDASESIDIEPSTMGYIAKALAQIGMGEPEKAVKTFNDAYWICHPDEDNLLSLIKTIMLFVAGKYEEVVRSLESVEACTSSNAGHHFESISVIFGGNLEWLRITMQRYHSGCKALHDAGRTEEAVEVLRKVLRTFDEEIRSSKIIGEWIIDLKRKVMHEMLGDAVLSSADNDGVLAQYTSANPSNQVDILTIRSKARALKGSWKAALSDAYEVIKLDPSSHLGYEIKCVALLGMEDYDEADNTVLYMLSIIENSPDERIRRLRANYTTPSEAIAVIDDATKEIFRRCPLVLIDLTTGRLCDAHERTQIFRSETQFKKLTSETTMAKIDRVHIGQSVAKYFEWIMFSHTWEGKEPTFKDINLANSVWELDKSPLNEKLCQFCVTAHKNGYRWAWSDTCCIDKDTSATLSRSLTSMYIWYEEAAETLVYLVDVLSSAELGALMKSRWMTRAWTLQELLASKVIRFYTSDWKLYLDDTHVNHKESPTIKQELAQAMGVAPETITSFHPEGLGVRAKLRLASTRNATVEEDVAYSLIGIFSSDIVPRYGLGKAALGQLLENIVARTGDITVVGWTGKSSSYNSALPASLAVYSQMPHSPPSMEANEFKEYVEQLHGLLERQDVLAFYNQVMRLPRATFSNRCLHLPCIKFPVKRVGVQGQDGGLETVYRAKVSMLGKVEFRTTDVIPLKNTPKLVFVHPWLQDLRDPPDVLSDNESDVESDDDSDESSTDTDDTWDLPSPLTADPLVPMNRYTRALGLIARLRRPFNALLLEKQPNKQYKRIAVEHEIIVSGVRKFKKSMRLRAKVLEIV